MALLVGWLTGLACTVHTRHAIDFACILRSKQFSPRIRAHIFRFFMFFFLFVFGADCARSWNEEKKNVLFGKLEHSWCVCSAPHQRDTFIDSIIFIFTNRKKKTKNYLLSWRAQTNRTIPINHIDKKWFFLPLLQNYSYLVNECIHWKMVLSPVTTKEKKTKDPTILVHFPDTNDKTRENIYWQQPQLDQIPIYHKILFILVLSLSLSIRVGTCSFGMNCCKCNRVQR